MLLIEPIINNLFIIRNVRKEEIFKIDFFLCLVKGG